MLKEHIQLEEQIKERIGSAKHGDAVYLKTRRRVIIDYSDVTDADDLITIPILYIVRSKIRMFLRKKS